jgi:hypothetical protein
VRVAGSATRTRPPATSSSPIATGVRNDAASRTTDAGSPAQAVTADARWPIVNIPCAITASNPAARATSSSRWSGFWSPLAPA